MIRIRFEDGSRQEVSVGASVEICSSDGKILQVITTDGQQIRIFEAGDKLFKQYCEAVGAEPAKRVDLR